MKRLLRRAIETALPTQATEPRATPLRTCTMYGYVCVMYYM